MKQRISSQCLRRKNNGEKAMIYELNNLSASDMYPFHMPGHKRQQTASLENNGGSDWLNEAYFHDITEIDGFDDLQSPKGMIADIEDRLAVLYGAKRAFLSVNGSTCGNLSAISALVQKNGCLLADMGAHRSVYNASFLSGCRILPLERETMPENGLTACISPEETEDRLNKAGKEGRLPDAVLITSPTYEGFISDVDRIADIVHGYGLPLIVDGAHGAHYTADEGTCFPVLSSKPDVTVVSLHKTLPAMTQTAAVLINGSLVRQDEVKRYINIFQTTSPSYILMASAERCLDIMEKEGFVLKKRLRENLDRTYALCKSLRHIYFTGPEFAGRYGIYDHDRSKINVMDRSGHMTGHKLYDIFREKYHLQPEKAGDRTCLLLTSVMDTEEGFQRLGRAIKELDEQIA